MKSKSSKRTVTTSVVKGLDNRNTIALMGSKLYQLKIKLDRKEKITKGDLRSLRGYLARINRYDESIWNQLTESLYTVQVIK